MRWIDDIIAAVNSHPSISRVHKQLLINRIEQWPSEEEFATARAQVEAQDHRDQTRHQLP